MSTSPLRKDIEDLVWKVTDDDYKKVSGSLRMLFYGGNWIPISELPERALEERIRTAKAHREVSITGNKYITDKPVNIAASMHTRKVTLYARDTTSMARGFLNGEKASKFLVEIGEYAQHKNAVRLYYVPKGKKNTREIISTAGRHYGRTYLVVLDGWDHPSFSTSTRVSSGPDVEVSAGRRTHEITEDIDAYVDGLSKKKILVDLRGHEVIEKKW